LPVGDVQWTDVQNKPAFFSGSYSDLTGKPVWLTTTQSSISLSGFNNDLPVGDVQWTDVQNKPTFFSGSYNDLTDKPGHATWLALLGQPNWTNYFSLGGTTETVTIGSNNFKSGHFAPNGQGVFDLGDSYARWRRVYVDEIYADKGIDAGNSRVTNIAPPIAHADAATKMYVDDAVGTGTTSWSGITDKPAWIDKFSYDDIGQYMDPTRPSNFDIVVSDSITPSAVSAFNIGQDLRRFLFGYF
jgi:hypothetical protein